MSGERVGASRTAPILAITVAILLAAAMLRAPIPAPAPLAGDIAAGLGVGASFVGLLTSIPVLCFAVLSAVAVWLADRIGSDLALTVCLGGAIAGCVLRSADGPAVAVAGALVIGAFITIGNIVVPAIIARDYPRRAAGTMSGLMSVMFIVGATTVTFAGAPLAAAVGWRVALASSLLFGVAALAVWLAAKGRTALTPQPVARARADEGATAEALRSPITWLLGVAFAGQAFSFYGMSAWLPSLLGDSGFPTVEAGAISGIFQVTAIPGALVIPLIARRWGPVPGVLLVAALWVFAPVGFLVAPELWWLWCVLGGVGQGGGLATVFHMIVTQGARGAAARSGAVQGIGYALAAVGPTLVGGLHDLTHAWVAPLLAILASTVAYGVFGVAAGVLVRRAHPAG